ncbi:phosphotransferase [Halothiobacillus sp.]|uniref:phosphotransferase enzyme family protein n=1 Tax=Halothiobacillus sp. TaxID=1891311 RepID=UPI002626E28D|nr:phosphotransferase [Halothiobacillus sp.]
MVLVDYNSVIESKADPLINMAGQVSALYPQLGSINEIQFVTSSENHTYRIISERGDFAMRVQRPGYHCLEEINAELQFVEVLSNNGIATAKPVRRSDGHFVSQLHTVEGDRLVTLFHWVKGHHPEEVEFYDTYGKMGSIMGRMHQVSTNITQDYTKSRPRWTLDEIIGSHAVWGSWDHPDYIDQPQRNLILGFIAELRSRLARYDSTGRYGLIHADMRPTNVLLHDGGVVTIDFDDCCHSWYLFDVAATVSFLEHRPDMPEWLGHFISQYQNQTKLSKQEVDLLPFFIGLRRVQLMAWYFSHRESVYCQSIGDTWLYQSFDVVSDIISHKISFN